MSGSPTTRAQRRRTRGWTAPPNSVYVGRPTPWGNPYSAQTLGRDKAVEWFRLYVQAMDADARRAWLAPLKGKVLLCWCKASAACHADVLIEWIEADTPRDSQASQEAPGRAEEYAVG